MVAFVLCLTGIISSLIFGLRLCGGLKWHLLELVALVSRFVVTSRVGGGLRLVIHSLGNFLVSSYKSRLLGSMVWMYWSARPIRCGMLGRGGWIANALFPPQSDVTVQKNIP